MAGTGTLAELAAELEKTAVALRSASETGSDAPKGVSNVLRAVLARLEKLSGIPDEAAALRARVAELEAENARLGGGGRWPLREEAEALVASGKPPEAYSDRVDRKERAEDFLFRVYGRFLETGREAIFQNELRKLDAKLVWALGASLAKRGAALSSLVPTKKERIDRTIASAGGGARAADLAKAAAAVEKRRKRSAGTT